MDINIGNFTDKIQEMEDKIDGIDGKLSQVIDALLGNPLTKQGGMTKEIDDLKLQVSILKTEVEHLKTFKNRILWTIGAIIVIGAVVKYITTIYSNIN